MQWRKRVYFQWLLLYRHDCFTGKYTTRKIHKNYIRDTSGLFSIISYVSLSMTYFGNFPSKFDGVLRLLNFTHTFFQSFCHCRALSSSVLFLKIIVTNVLYCCTVNLSRHNYFLANNSPLFYRCLFVYIIKRTLQGGLKI